MREREEERKLGENSKLRPKKAWENWERERAMEETIQVASEEQISQTQPPTRTPGGWKSVKYILGKSIVSFLINYWLKNMYI